MVYWKGRENREETRRGCEYCAVNSVCGKVCLQLHSDAPDPEQRASRAEARTAEPVTRDGPTRDGEGDANERTQRWSC